MTRRRTRLLPGVQDLLNDYLSFLIRHRGLSSSSHKDHRHALHEFFEYLAARGIRISEVSVRDLDDFIFQIGEKGKSKVYVGKRTKALRGFLRYLFSEGWIEKDLSGFVESPRIYRESTVPPHFTWSELGELLASVKGNEKGALRDRALLSLLCAYGLRAGEAAGLTLDNIDWIHKTVQVCNRKGGIPLLLPLLPAVEVALREYIDKGRLFTVPYREIFLNRHGKPMKDYSIISWLPKLVQRAGLKGGRGCHAIRHAVGTHLLEEGKGLTEVALVLGHKNLESARVYVRLSMEMLREVADNYGEML